MLQVPDRLDGLKAGGNGVVRMSAAPIDFGSQNCALRNLCIPVIRGQQRVELRQAGQIAQGFYAVVGNVQQTEFD